MTLSYLTKSEAVTGLNRFTDATLTTSDLPDWDVAIAEGRVNTELEKAGIETPASDYNNFLKFATFYTLLDDLSQSGLVTSSTGRVQLTEFGKQSTQFNKENMFFFSFGDTKSRLRYMRDQETPSQKAMGFIHSYVKWKNKEDTGSFTVMPTISFDVTSRGFGWDRKITEIDDDNTASTGTDY